MKRPLEVTLERLFAEAQQTGKATAWLSHGLVEMDSRICVFEWSPYEQASSELQRPRPAL